MVVIVFGLPGSGKSYFAQRLARLMQADYLNSDRIRSELFQHRTYLPGEKSAVYVAMLAQMNSIVQQNRGLVLDATFHKKDTREKFIQAMQHKGGIIFIEVRANEQVIRERLKNTRPYSEAGPEVYALIQQQWEPLTAPHLVLESTDTNIEAMLQTAATHLHLNYDNRTDS